MTYKQIVARLNARKKELGLTFNQVNERIGESFSHQTAYNALAGQ